MRIGARGSPFCSELISSRIRCGGLERQDAKTLGDGGGHTFKHDPVRKDSSGFPLPGGKQRSHLSL